MRRAYTIWACPRCGEGYMFAGSCDEDGERLVNVRVIPVTIVQEFRDMWLKTASPVPRWFIEHFVKSLLEFASTRKTSDDGAASQDQLPKL